MALVTFLGTPVDVTPGSNNTWDDQDLSGTLPAGATGVVVRTTTAGAGGNIEIGIRNDGSTDTPLGYNGNLGGWAYHSIGCAGRVIETYASSKAKVYFEVVAYYDSGATFFVNAKTRSITGSNYTWVDADWSSDCSGAEAIITQHYGLTYYARHTGIRCNGSSDTMGETGQANSNPLCHVMPCDSGQVCEVYRITTDGNIYAVGYITDGATWYSNGQDYSLGTAGDWYDLTQLPSGAGGGFFDAEVGSYSMGMRKNGTSEDTYGPLTQYAGWVAEADASRYVEGKIEDTALDWWLQGYIETATVYDETGKTQTLLVTGAKSDAAVRDETGLSQTLLATQAHSDAAVRDETGLVQTLLIEQSEWDQKFYDETGKIQMLLVTQGAGDTQDMVESVTQVLLITQAESDEATYDETGLAQTLLMYQAESDAAVWDDTGSAAILLIYQEAGDTFIPGGGPGPSRVHDDIRRRD